MKMYNINFDKPKVFTIAATLFVAVANADVKTYQFSIDQKLLSDALVEFSDKTNMAVMYGDGVQADNIVLSMAGDFSPEEALSKILAGTGLSYQRVEGNVFLIVESDDHGVVRSTDQNPVTKTSNKSSLREQNTVIEEITITATKRETRLQDTAMSITALGSDAIEKRGLVQMGDYLSTLPGVTMQDRGAGFNSIVIRGIATQPQVEKEAVGVYFGDSPVSGVKGAFDDGGHADFKMVDIERVEVLRGPQGTLYGAGSMGGTVRIIPAAPNLNQVEGKIAAQYSQTGKLGGDNTMVQGVINVPLVDDKLALRGVAYRFDDSGYVENIAASYTGPGNVVDLANAWGGSVNDEGNIGDNQTTGARLSALWQPIESLSATLGYVWQKTDQKGYPQVDTYLPSQFQQVRITPGSAAPPALNGDTLGTEEGVEIETELTFLNIEYDLGWGSLYSSSSWLSRDSLAAQDWSRILSVFGNLWILQPMEHDFFVQEIRFASSFEGPVQVLAGAYYEDRDQQRYTMTTFAGDPEKTDDLIAAVGWPLPVDAPPGFTADGWTEFSAAWDWKESLKQTAYFGEVTWNITDQLAATVGVRHYEYDQSTYATNTGYVFNRLTPVVARDMSGENKGETWKFNLSWTPVEDMLVYFQWAEGFRPGDALNPYPLADYDPDNTGFYTLVADGTKVPIRDQTDPDTLENFELGFKGTFADNRILVNTSLYRINWAGLPVQVGLYNFTLGRGFAATTVNVGESVSEGVELETQWQLTDFLHLDLNASWNESKLAKDQAGLGSKGDDLPGSADFNFSAGLEYGFSLAGYDAFARIDYAYLSEFETFIGQDDTVPSSGGYGQIHLKSGMNFGRLNVDLFVKNLTDEDDFTWVSSSPSSTTAYRLRPRTIGLNFGYQF